MTTVSFPGLGIGEFSLDPVAISFELFGNPIEIRWYGAIICLGMILAVLYVCMRAKQAGIAIDHILDFALVIIPCGVIGARLYYVLMRLDSYDSIKDVFAIWNGGLAIYGGIIAGGLALLICAKIKKLSLGKIFDMVAPAVMIGQILGRWGNFFNGEAHGGETDIFCRMGLFEGNQWSFVHPTFLYESLWNLLGFVIANLIYRKKKYDGQVFFFYVAWYGFGRMLIEGLRTDSLYLFGTGIRVSQLVGFLCFIIGTAFFVTLWVRAARKAPAPAETTVADEVAAEENSAEE